MVSTYFLMAASVGDCVVMVVVVVAVVVVVVSSDFTDVVHSALPLVVCATSFCSILWNEGSPVRVPLQSLASDTDIAVD